MHGTAAVTDPVTEVICELGVSVGRGRMLIDRLERLGEASAAAALRMGLETVEEALLRLGVALAGEHEHPQ